VSARARTVASDARAAGMRTARGLRKPKNWLQLAKFCAVGASGYLVNLAVYASLVELAGMDYRLAAVCSFVVAVSNNYAWNRVWTFRDNRGRVGMQGARFFTVALVALVANLIVLEALVRLGLGEVPAQAVAIVLVTPINFVGNKLWSFGRH
jgi:dolichol-phosphate mannosyltransferase